MKQELAGLLAAYLAMQLVTWWLVGQLSQAGGLGFPALIALCQNLCTTVFLGPVMVVSWDPVEDHAARRWWRELTLIGLAGTLTVFLQSCTPTDFTVAPEYQMARAFTPLITSLMAMGIGSLSTIPKEEVLALLLVGLGAAAAVHSRAMMMMMPASEGALSSVLSQLATFAGAASLALSERAVRDLGALELTFYSSAMTSTMLVPLFLAAEYKDFKDTVSRGELDPEFVPLLAVACLLSLCYWLVCNRLLLWVRAAGLALLEEACTVSAITGCSILVGPAANSALFGLMMMSLLSFGAGTYMHVLGAGWFSDANQRGEDLEGAQKGSLGTHHGQHHCRVDMEAQQGPVRPRRMSLEIYRVPYTVLASKTRVLPFAMARKDSGSGDILIGATLLGDHGLQILWGNGSQHHEAPRHHKQ